MYAILTLLLVLTVSTGCHSWRHGGADRKRLSLLTEAPAGTTPGNAGMIDPAPASWTTAGGDSLAPTIEQLRQHVSERSPAVRTAEAALAAARARAAQAGRWSDPQLEGRVLIHDGNPEAEGALRLALPLNGAAGAAGRAASLATERAEIALAGTRFRAERDLDRILAEVATEEERSRLFEELSARAVAYADLARQRQTAGLADPLDVSLIMAGAARDRRSALQSQDETRRLRAELARLLGVGAHLAVEAPPPPARAPGIPEIDVLLRQAEQSSSVWRGARLAYEEAEWHAARAARARIPNPTLGPAVTANDERTTWGVTFGIELPIFANRGAAYAEALAERDAAYESLLAERQRTRSRVQRLHEHLRAVDQQLELTTEEPLAASRNALALAEDRYEAGQIDVVVLLSAYRAHADLLQEILDLRLERELARLDLETLIGYPLDRLSDRAEDMGEQDGGDAQ